MIDTKESVTEPEIGNLPSVGFKKVWVKPELERLSMKSTQSSNSAFDHSDGGTNYS